MKRKRRSAYHYNDAVLKSGYEEMAQINLGFAESGLGKASDDLLSYEQSLVANVIMERGDFDD